MDLNRATLLGRLTRDPEIRSTPSGQSVATIGVATGRVWTDQNGVKQERTEFHNCVLWGKLADIAGQYLSKGRRVYLEGRLETKDWAGQDGVKRYRTEIIVENMIMLDGPRGSAAPQANAAPSQTFGNDSNDQTNSDDEIKVEDIPF
jgi:single-strand DNA-binding protein